MRWLLSCIITVLFPLFFTACAPCASLDCISSNYYLSFRIVRASDSADLVFGRHRIYNRDQFHFYSLKGGDTIQYQLSPSGYALNAPEDSLLNVNFYPRSDTAYMVLSNGDVDTLAMTFNTYKTKCCGTITEITKFRLNNRIDLSGNEGPQIITK